MDLIVNEVMQFEIIHIADRGSVLKRLARSAIVELDLAVDFAVFVDNTALLEEFFDILLVCTVEDRSCNLPIKHMSDEAEVHFKNLSDVHT